MSMGVSFDPVLPLPPDRPAPPPEAAGSPGGFEELIRVEAPPRRADSPPRADEPPPADDAQAAAIDDAATITESNIAPAAPKNRELPESDDESKEQSEEDKASETTLAPAATVAAGVPAPEVPPSEVANPQAAPAGETSDQPPAETKSIPPFAEAADPSLAANHPKHQPKQNAATPAEETLPPDSPPREIELEVALPKVEIQTAPAAKPNQPDAPDNAPSEAEKKERRNSASPQVAARPAEVQVVAGVQAVVQEVEADEAGAGGKELSLEAVTNKVPEPPTEQAPADTLPQPEAARPKPTTEHPAASPTVPHGTDERSARLSSADRVRFVQRVARAVEAARPDGEIRLRLRPPELGSIHLRVKTEGGVLAAHVETETRQAQSLLADRIPELRERLAEMNIRMERFDVEYRGGGEERSQSFAQHRGDGGERDFGFQPRPASPRDEIGETNRAEPRFTKLHRGDLDVLV